MSRAMFDAARCVACRDRWRVRSTIRSGHLLARKILVARPAAWHWLAGRTPLPLGARPKAPAAAAAKVVALKPLLVASGCDPGTKKAPHRCGAFVLRW